MTADRIRSDTSVLLVAHGLVHGDRGDRYGPPELDYGRTVALFQLLTGHGLTAAEGCLFMLCVKLSREAHRHTHDNVVDAAGYLDCYDQALRSEQQPHHEDH